MTDNNKPEDLKLSVSNAVHTQTTENVNLEIKEVIKRTADVLEKTNTILASSSRDQRKQFWINLIMSGIMALATIGLVTITVMNLGESKKLRQSTQTMADKTKSLADETKMMAAETKRLTDFNIEQFKIKAYPTFITNIKGSNFSSEQFTQQINIKNKGEITAQKVRLLLVNIYLSANKNYLFKNEISVYYKEKEWMTSLNYERPYFKDETMGLTNTTRFPANQSIGALKYCLLYLKFNIPYDEKAHYEVFCFLTKKLRGTSESRFNFKWIEVDKETKDELIDRHLEALPELTGEGIRFLRDFMKEYGKQG